MKKLCYLLVVLWGCTQQESTEEIQGPDIALFDRAYETFREDSITERKFKHADIEPLILQRKDGGIFTVEQLGVSVEERSICQLTCGQGKTKVMLWSQMHGDESTATMALFDLFNFLEGSNDGFDSLRNLILENTTLYFIPMLNPDGAEEFKRRNSYDFDLNRDAVRQAAPEAVILRKAREKQQPDFGFNLHDQSIYYNVSGTPNPATISVLAPAFNEAREVNDVRRRAMQVIVGMNNLLQEYIPQGVGKYDDSFEPRAFGDNFQKWGTSTILIESGGYPDDPEKQFIRKLNFAVILGALADIASGNYRQYEEEQYFSIPDNDSKLTDLLIKNLEVNRGDSLRYQTDISVRRNETSAYISDLGDLSVLHGYKELDATGYTWREGKIYEKTYPSPASLDREEAISLLKQGYCAVRVSTLPDDSGSSESPDLPILLLQEEDKLTHGVHIGRPGNFLLSKDGQPAYAVIRGELIEL